MTRLPILLVDDNRAACNMLAKCLSVFGYQADVAYDGPAALKLVEQKRYGLTISDYQMPGMNGVELFRCMRRLWADLPGVLLTGLSKAAVESSAAEAGIQNVLSKPTSFQELIPIIEQELSRATPNGVGG
jgi:CheY-like chemotaxis protein